MCTIKFANMVNSIIRMMSIVSFKCKHSCDDMTSLRSVYYFNVEYKIKKNIRHIHQIATSFICFFRFHIAFFVYN